MINLAPRSARAAGALIALGAVIAGWQVVSAGVPGVLVPSPMSVASALAELARSGELFVEFGRTTLRSVAAVLLATAVGIALGAIAAGSTFADGAIGAIRGIMSGLPPIVVVVVLMLWWGADPWVAIVVAALVMCAPIVAATQAAIGQIDPQLTDMARAFGIPRRTRLLHVSAPMALPVINSAVRTQASGAVRIILMVEVLAAHDGAGASIAYARSMLQTPEVFAWAVAAVAYALTADAALGRLGTRRAFRQRRYPARRANLRRTPTNNAGFGTRMG